MDTTGVLATIQTSLSSYKNPRSTDKGYLDDLIALRNSFSSFREKITFTKNDFVNAYIDAGTSIAGIFVGHTELEGNEGFWCDTFNGLVHAAEGSPYCSSFTEFVWMLASDFIGAPDLLLSNTAGSQTLASWAEKNGCAVKVPEIGALTVWRNGSEWKGHVAACIISFDKKSFEDIEANTSNPKSQWRDGRFVMIKTHPIGKIGQALKEGRWLRCFVSMRLMAEKYCDVKGYA